MKRRMAVVFCLVGMLLPAMGQEDGAAKGEGASGGRTVALWGHVKDAFTYVGIPDVFITLMRADSTVVDTMHVACANPGTPQMDSYYKFDVPAAPQRFIIKAEHPDYRTTYVDFRLRRIGRNTYVDAPHHEMRRKPYDPFSDRALDEVVVKATKIRVAYKGDTLVYNADAFNLPEGSMLDELIRQMPGVELKQNGEIYVNGRKVDYLTLNGTDFFKGDNRKMLDNLPSYTVQQVKVYHKDTERSAFLGYRVDPQEYVMDVRLKREYNSGYMANASLGGGTDSRYKGQAFGMRYSDRSRVSLFGSANNTNAVYGRPGENGEWPEESMKNGEFVAQSAGGILLRRQRPGTGKHADGGCRMERAGHAATRGARILSCCGKPLRAHCNEVECRCGELPCGQRTEVENAEHVVHRQRQGELQPDRLARGNAQRDAGCRPFAGGRRRNRGRLALQSLGGMERAGAGAEPSVHPFAGQGVELRPVPRHGLRREVALGRQPASALHNLIRAVGQSGFRALSAGLSRLGRPRTAATVSRIRKSGSTLSNLRPNMSSIS